MIAPSYWVEPKTGLIVKWIMTPPNGPPRTMIEGYQQRHNLSILHSWGMTELCPVGTIGSMPHRLSAASSDEQFAYRAKQGRQTDAPGMMRSVARYWSPNA